MAEWWTFFAGLLFGGGIGWSLAAKTHAPSEPPKPRPCDHNWIYNVGKDGVIWTCVTCTQTKVNLYTDLVAASRARDSQSEASARPDSSRN